MNAAPSLLVRPLPLPDDCYRTFDRACGSSHPRSECQGEWICRWRCIPCRLAATTPPSTHVIRLDSGVHGPRRTLDALKAAMEAAEWGGKAVQVATGPPAYHFQSYYFAKYAATLARLALGVV